MVTTIRDVARAAGVSPATVSRALSSPDMVNEVTRRRVKRVALAMSYEPNRNARSLVTGRTGGIGIVVPDLENPFFASICKGVQRRARALGYTAFIGDSDEDLSFEPEIVRSLIKQVDGVILCSTRITDLEIRQLAEKTPLILANRRLSGVPSVTFDYKAGLLMTIEHLVALGHSRIAYAAGPLQSWVNGQYARVFAEVAQSEPAFDLIELGNFSPNFLGGLRAADLAIASHATAVVAYNDFMALGVIDRLGQRGLSVPSDLSVTGFNDIAAAVSPNVTTVNYPGARMGHLCVDSLTDVIAGSESRQIEDCVLPVELVVRRSTGEHTASAEFA